MPYDKKLLEKWSRMPDWGDYMDKNGGLTELTSKDGFDFLQKEYYLKVKKRINHCKKLIKEHEDAFLNYVLAELYDRCNEDESPLFLYKRSVIYYAKRSLEFDPHFLPSKKLLERTREWIDFLGGDSRENRMPDFNWGPME